MKRWMLKCPYCLAEFRDNPERIWMGHGEKPDEMWQVAWRKCPACERLIVHLEKGQGILQKRGSKYSQLQVVESSILILPKASSRPPCPSQVPPDIAEDYREACLVLPDSPKASAALSRRCLQDILRQKAGIHASNLADEIEQVLDSGKLPSHIAEIIDAVRHIGNFAAHPIKSQQTGQIVQVEPGEAELNLNVLEALFDFYYVQPDIIAKKKQALNQKLQDAGKPPMK